MDHIRKQILKIWDYHEETKYILQISDQHPSKIQEGTFQTNDKSTLIIKMPLSLTAIIDITRTDLDVNKPDSIRDPTSSTL